MKQTACYILLCLALGLSTAAAISVADLKGTWRGHCLEYATQADSGSGFTCMSYKGAPNRYPYNITYSDTTFSYFSGGSMYSGTYTLAKSKTYSCVTAKFSDGGVNAFAVDAKLVSGASVRTYTEEGVYSMPDGKAYTTCLVKGTLGGRLYCDAKRSNYICTASFVTA